MSLIKNSIWNVFGAIFPLALAVPIMGYIARSLSIEGFGIFTIIFTVVGYASLFDMGLSRAVIREIAIANQDVQIEKKVLGTASICVLVLSIFGSLIFSLSSELLVDMLSVSGNNRDDAILSFRLISLSLPFLLLSSVWFAFLEGKSRFFELGVLRSITGAITFLLPAIGIFLSPSLMYAMVGLLTARIFTAIVSYYYCVSVNGFSLRNFDRLTLARLVNFGGWLTVSNVISPLLVFADRLVISNQIGAGVVAFYSAPAELVSKMAIFPQSISRVFFQRISGQQQNDEGYISSAERLNILICIIAAVFFLFFSEAILTVWLGSGYVGESIMVLKIMSVGFVFNSMAQIPFSLIQAKGYSDVTAKIHMLEFFPYLFAIAYAATVGGLIYAAVVWSLRMVFDFFLVRYFAKKYVERRH